MDKLTVRDSIFTELECMFHLALLLAILNDAHDHLPEGIPGWRSQFYSFVSCNVSHRKLSSPLRIR